MVSDEHKWFSEDEACEYIGCDRDYLMELVTRKVIPHSKLPKSDQIRFSLKRLDKWLGSLDATSLTRREDKIPDELSASDESFQKEIFTLFDKNGFKMKKKSRYTNFYIALKVKSQVHEIKTGGLALAIPEADYLPKYENLASVKIEDLVGYWGANSDWLEGNSKRFTRVKAKAFILPDDMYQDPSHPAWSEIADIIDRILKQ